MQLIKPFHFMYQTPHAKSNEPRKMLGCVLSAVDTISVIDAFQPMAS